MTNHESRDLIQEIVIEIIEQLEQREQLEQKEQLEQILIELIEQIEQIEQLEKREQKEQLEQILIELIEQIEQIEQRAHIKYKKPVKPPFHQVSNKRYHYVISCVRFFLIEKGLFECCSQCKFPILSSHNEHTHQLYLEHELLHNSNVTGYFCVTNVNIEHANSIPAVEFVINGDIHVLESFTHDLLVYLCYPSISNYIVKDYSYITTKLNMNINYLSKAVKQKIYAKFGATFLIKNYPANAPAHWTIKKNYVNNTYNKLVTILSGIESIISYEISTNKHDMLHQFNNNGHLCNSADMNAELDQYLSQSFITRSYGKISTLALIDSMIKERLIPDFYV
jgi:hypothetical protein